MFFDISAKSQVNTFSINENYAGLVLASDINRLSCSIDTNSMNDNIFSNNSGNIYNSGSVRNYVDSFKTVIGDFNFSKIIFFKDAIVCCISIPCIQEERKNFSFIYNGRSILFVDYDNFLTDIFSIIIEENINEIKESQDFIYFMLKNILKHDLETLILLAKICLYLNLIFLPTPLIITITPTRFWLFVETHLDFTTIILFLWIYVGHFQKRKLL